MGNATRKGKTTRRRPRTEAEREAAAEAKRARRKQLDEQLDEFTAERDEDELADLAAPFLAKYSLRNCLLIVMQDEQATDVRGYYAWQDAGRQVISYPEGEGGITIVAYRGDDRGKNGGSDVQAEPAAANAGAQGEAEEKTARRFGLDTVHDVRNTVPILCGDCGRPAHRTGYDKATRRHQFTHTGVRDADHPARPQTREEREAAATGTSAA